MNNVFSVVQQSGARNGSRLSVREDRGGSQTQEGQAPVCREWGPAGLTILQGGLLERAASDL